jgi:hypothetical protein
MGTPVNNDLSNTNRLTLSRELKIIDNDLFKFSIDESSNGTTRV